MSGCANCSCSKNFKDWNLRYMALVVELRGRPCICNTQDLIYSKICSNLVLAPYLTVPSFPTFNVALYNRVLPSVPTAHTEILSGSY